MEEARFWGKLRKCLFVCGNAFGRRTNENTFRDKPALSGVGPAEVCMVYWYGTPVYIAPEPSVRLEWVGHRRAYFQV